MKTSHTTAADACLRLRRALHAADIRSLDPAVDGDGLAHLHNLDGHEAVRLCVLLEAGAAGSAAPGLSRSVNRSAMSVGDTIAVRKSLNRLLTAMAIGDLSVRIFRHEPVIHIRNVDTAGADTLAEMLWTALGQYTEAAHYLRMALQRHGLVGGIEFVPDVRALRITLGDVSVRSAAILASVLDGAPVPDGDLDNADYPEAFQVEERLHVAVKATGCVMATAVHSYCEKCGTGPSITLGDLDLDSARRLVAALGSSTVRPAEKTS
ncbi:hypothetical protein [Streptomyces sp. NPDC059928]|uniref:hypothetical protein n=1 Tax=unclassified Streptomyces TaxID=2593676 RepID=UPI0036569169